MKRIITFVVTAFYAATASAQEKTGLLGDLVNKGKEAGLKAGLELAKPSWLTELVNWWEQLTLWPTTWGGLIAFAMITYGLGTFYYRKNLSKNKWPWLEIPLVILVGWLTSMSLDWLNVAWLGWMTLVIPITYQLLYQPEWLVKRLRGTVFQKLNRDTPKRRSLQERLQTALSSKTQSLEECPNCHEPNLGSKFCTAGCGYRRPTAETTSATTTVREAVTPPASIPRNLSEAVDLAGDDF